MANSMGSAATTKLSSMALSSLSPMRSKPLPVSISHRMLPCGSTTSSLRKPSSAAKTAAFTWAAFASASASKVEDGCAFLEELPLRPLDRFLDEVGVVHVASNGVTSTPCSSNWTQGAAAFGAGLGFFSLSFLSFPGSRDPDPRGVAGLSEVEAGAEGASCL